MSRSVRDCFLFVVVVGFALPASARTPAASEVKEPLRFTVRVYNYARVPRKTLERAKAEAAAVFRNIRVGTAWLDCDPSVEGFPRNPACKPNPLPTQVVLRLLPRSMAEPLGLDPKNFGLALPAKRRGFGSVTNVFYHRVKELCKRLHLDRDLILGHIMAHEMGHLFLGIGSHSDRGIMHIPWRTKQLDRAAKGNLHFTPAQSKQIRAQVLERLQAEQDDRRSQPE